MFNRKIIAVQSDWGGEYECLNSFFRTLGIIHLVSCPHAHQQNDAAERKHRHIVEMGLTLLAHATMPLNIGIRRSLQLLICSIAHPLKFLIMIPPSIAYLVLHQITPTCAPLDACVGPTSDPTTATSSNFIPSVVRFLDIVISTRGINVLTLVLVACISLMTSSLMKIYSLLHNCHHM
jgi:hypothetical protein